MALSVSFLAVGAAAALLVSSPSNPIAHASVTALAIPGTAVIGERTEAYGAAVSTAPVPLEGRFVVCDRGTCAGAGRVELLPNSEWHGLVGALRAARMGPVVATWFIAEPSDVAGARTSTLLSVVVTPIEAEAARHSPR